MCNQRNDAVCGHGSDEHTCGNGHEGHSCGGHEHGGCGHDHAEVFENTYRDYLEQIKGKGIAAIAGRMGVDMRDGAVPVILLGQEFIVSEDGIEGPGGRELSFAEKVVLCKYFLMYPEAAPQESEDFVSYRDFPDAAPFVGGFKTNAELPIAKSFGGIFGELKKAAADVGGEDPEMNLGYDLTRVFQALPEVTLLLLFNDADDEFPASALLLFQRRAQHFLDMECLAGLGWLLADRLAGVAGIRRHAIM